jgi:hypothetical protein
VAVIDDAAQMIRTRLDELNLEKEKLERVLGELGSNAAPRRGRAPGRRKPGPKPGRRSAASSKAAGKPGRRRGSAARIPRAEREQAILVFLKSNPSASAKEIGVGVGTTANYVNNMLTGLRKQGRLVRKADGAQVEVKAAAVSSAATKPAAAKPARKKPGRKKSSGKGRVKKPAAGK